MIERKFVQTLLERFQAHSALINIVVGPRQVGKTTGILQFLKKYQGAYHYISADAVLTAGHAWILEQWQAAKLKDEQALLVIDEIQKIDNWAEIIKKLWDEQVVTGGRLKLLLSGSSSLSLSHGMSESLAGRLETLYVMHWDYCESHELAHLSLEDYLKYGGYPKSYEFINDLDHWSQYVRTSLIDRVIDKDILQYAHVKAPALFRQAFELVCCYPSQEISYRKLLGQLQDKGNTDLIKHYLALFEGAFLIKTLQKYHNQAIKVKSSSPKIIILAPCFYTLFSVKNEKQSFVFESTVGAKLLQIASKLYYWREDKYEVDFVMEWRGHLIAIEVKSGGKRKANGLARFCSQFAHAIPIIISKDNYTLFISDPVSFFERLIG
jgi:predicted AAA+ superfamily ATPase